MSHLINDRGVCRTAPATPGLLNTWSLKFDFSDQELYRYIETFPIQQHAQLVNKSNFAGLLLLI